MKLITNLCSITVFYFLSPHFAWARKNENKKKSFTLKHFPITIQAPSTIHPSITFLPSSNEIGVKRDFETENDNEDPNIDVSFITDVVKVHQHNMRELNVTVVPKASNETKKNKIATTLFFHHDDSIVIDGLHDRNEIPIDNDVFEGKMVILLRANPELNYVFGGDENILWEFQVQGKFKRKTGPLYISVEIPEEEDLKISWGLKAVANAFCKLIRFFGYNLHKSLGEGDDIPHFASPAFQAFDKFIATNISETDPPQLGQEIDEPHESCIQRRKFEKNHIIDTSLVYTMSFNDTFFNPASWSVNGIPFFKSIDMSSFTNRIRLVFYEVEEENNRTIDRRDGNVQQVAKGRHTKRNSILWFQMHNPMSH